MSGHIDACGCKDVHQAAETICGTVISVRIWKDRRNIPVPKIKKVAANHLTSLKVVRADRRQSGVVAIVPEKYGRCGLLMQELIRGLPMVEPDQCHAIDAMLEHFSSERVFPLEVIAMRGQKDCEPLFLDRLGKTLNQFRENRMVNCGHNQADSATTNAMNCLRGAVPNVS